MEDSKQNHKASNVKGAIWRNPTMGFRSGSGSRLTDAQRFACPPIAAAQPRNTAVGGQTAYRPDGRDVSEGDSGDERGKESANQTIPS